MKNDTRPKPPPLGIIFALPIEAHTFERRLGNATKYQGQKSVIYEGYVSDHPVVWTISGVGQEAARNAAQLIIDGHQPHTLVSAGFAGALAPAQCQRNPLWAVILRLDSVAGFADPALGVLSRRLVV